MRYYVLWDWTKHFTVRNPMNINNKMKKKKTKLGT